MANVIIYLKTELDFRLVYLLHSIMLQLMKNAHVQGSFLGYAKKHDEFFFHQRQISRQIASQPNLLFHGFVMNYGFAWIYSLDDNDSTVR